MLCHKCGSHEKGQYCRKCGSELLDTEALTVSLAEHPEIPSLSKASRGFIVKEEAEENKFRVELWGVVVAGQPIEAICNREAISVPSDFQGRDLFALRVRGDSMIGEQMREGDYIIVKSRRIANNGDLVVALVDGCDATVKRFYKEHNQVRLQPANPRYKPIIISPPNRVTIQGVVIGLIRKYKS